MDKRRILRGCISHWCFLSCWREDEGFGDGDGNVRKRGLGNVGTGEIRIEVHEKREMDGVERIGRLRDVEGLMMDIFAFLCFSNVDPNFNMSVFFLFFFAVEVCDGVEVFVL